jgi:hypothetical protein
MGRQGERQALLLRAFSPILRRGGRPLVAAGDFGTLRSLPSTVHQRRGRAERYIKRTYRSWPS